MAKFQTRAPKATSPVGVLTTEATPTAVTHEGGPGFTHDAKGELFRLAAVNMSGEDTFYESAKARDDRFVRLVREVTATDPQWVARFAGYLRGRMQMRSASVVLAAESARFRQENPDVNTAGGDWTIRRMVDAVLQRADEPAEFIAYWQSRFGRTLPGGVQRGLADATARLYTDNAVVKYDTKSRPWRFADVLNVTHPKGVRADVAEWAMARRYDRVDIPDVDTDTLTELPEAVAEVSLSAAAVAGGVMREVPASDRAGWFTDPANLHTIRTARWPWESVAGWVGEMTGPVWDVLIPRMGYMALLRNLRNFDQAGISDASYATVVAKLTDPGEVAQSRQFPFRFLSAYDASAGSDRWRVPLGTALDLSVASVPVFPGRTLVLVDTSGSMEDKLSEKSSVSRMAAGALFGVAVTRAAERAGGSVDLHGFAGNGWGWERDAGTVTFHHPVPKGASTLGVVQSMVSRCGEVGHGTMIGAALRQTFLAHDRVVIFTDQQSADAANGAVPDTVPVYAFDLAGYARTSLAGGVNRFQLAGFSDKVFDLLPMLETGRDGNWPF